MRSIVLIGLWMMTSVVYGQQQQQVEDDKPYDRGALIVQLQSNDMTDDVNEKLKSIHPSAAIKEEVSDIMHAWMVRFDPLAISEKDMMKQLWNFSEITNVEFDYKVYLRETIPNDQLFNQQWFHKNTGQTGGTTNADIQSYDAWDITTGGKTILDHDIVVCIIESANVMGHPDLEENHWTNEAEIPNNGQDDDGNGYVDDYNGWNVQSNNDDIGSGSHGTSVAGMIGAKGDNGVGVAGANWDVKIMVVAGHSPLTQSRVIQAYTYPLKMRRTFNESKGEVGAFVVATNASWGIDGANPGGYQLWCNFYDTLGTAGILNCGATSNSNLNVDVSGDMPTGCSSDYMIGVGRSDADDNYAGGYGLNTIDLAAPGINVYTTSQTAYTNTTGTSFSSPLTAGVIGLMYSIPCQSFMDTVFLDPQRGADLVRQALLGGVDKKPQLSNAFITGGRLNAFNAIDSLMTLTCVPCGIEDVVVEDEPCASAEAFVYDLTGSAELIYPPLTGTLTISHSDGVVQEFQAPFDSIVNFTLSDVPANGESYTIEFSFSEDSACSFTYEGSHIDGCSSELSTAFSPNGDNVNDFWEIKNVEVFENNSVSIFNRWGVEVYQVEGYDNTTVFWNGENKNGEMLPSGTYFYIIESDNNDPVKGWVEIMK